MLVIPNLRFFNSRKFLIIKCCRMLSFDKKITTVRHGHALNMSKSNVKDFNYGKFSIQFQRQPHQYSFDLLNDLKQ